MEEPARQATTERRSCRPRCSVHPLGPILIAVDSNILVYAFREEFDQNESARSVLRGLAEGDAAWGLPVFVIGEFLRVVTHPSYLDPPADRTTAVGNVDALLASPSCRLLLPGDGFWSLLRTVMDDAQATGNLVFDALIVATCLEHGANEILSEDIDLRRFTSVRLRRLGEDE